MMASSADKQQAIQQQRVGWHSTTSSIQAVISHTQIMSLVTAFRVAVTYNNRTVPAVLPVARRRFYRDTTTRRQRARVTLLSLQIFIFIMSTKT
jgi:hypothetical protein